MEIRFLWKNKWALQKSKSDHSIKRMLSSVIKHLNNEVDTKKDSQEVKNFEPVEIPFNLTTGLLDVCKKW